MFFVYVLMYFVGLLLSFVYEIMYFADGLM